MWYKKAFVQSEFWNDEKSNDPKSLQDAFSGVITDSKTRTSDPYKIFQNLKTYKQKMISDFPDNNSEIGNAFDEAVESLKVDFPDFKEESSSISGDWLDVAKSYLGTPYEFGGSDKSGIDCSAFVQNVFKSQNIDLPRTTSEQINVGEKISLDDNWQSGDRLYFSFGRLGKGNADHTGIYIGNNQFIQASSSKGVTVSDISDDSYYRKALIAVRR
jgi:cell wall-associated NlpC family hydrolase